MNKKNIHLENNFNTVEIFNNLDFNGRGFFIAPHLVITAAHVVASNNDIRMLCGGDSKGEKYIDATGNRIWMDSSLDLAIINVNNNDVKTSICKSIRFNNIQIGDEVFYFSTIKMNDKKQKIFHKSYISFYKHDSKNIIGLSTNKSLSYGDSGTPIFNKNNDVIGVLTGKMLDNNSDSFPLVSYFNNEFYDYLEKLTTTLAKDGK